MSMRAAVLAALAILVADVRADSGIVVRDAWVGEESFAADIDIELPETLNQGVDKGLDIPLVLEVHLFEQRPYWFDRHIGNFSWSATVAHDRLLGDYRVTHFDGNETHEATLGAALDAVSNVRGLPTRGISGMLTAENAVAAIRLEVDLLKLPAPLQIELLASSEVFSSGWLVVPAAEMVK